MPTEIAANETMVRFGYPDMLVLEFEHWVVLLRRHQATLGALILACREEATAFAGISAGAFAELATATRAIEDLLQHAFAYDKINYLMLMMADPNPHFHVIPRYAKSVTFEGVAFDDPGWPRIPDMGHATDIGDDTRAALLRTLRDAWPPN